MKVGETWVMAVPPGWLIGGTIVEITDEVIIFKDAVYLETVEQGHSPLSSIPRAKTARELKAAMSAYWGLPDGYMIRKEAIFHAGRCLISLAPLAGAEAAKAIEEAG